MTGGKDQHIHVLFGVRDSNNNPVVGVEVHFEVYRNKIAGTTPYGESVATTGDYSPSSYVEPCVYCPGVDQQTRRTGIVKGMCINSAQDGMYEAVVTKIVCGSVSVDNPVVPTPNTNQPFAFPITNTVSVDCLGCEGTSLGDAYTCTP